MFLRSCWLLQNCFNKNNISIHCLITSGSSLLSEFCMDPAYLTWQLKQVSLFLLLPKIAHPVTFPVMCELCKKENKDSVSEWLNQQLFKLSVQDICTFFPLGTCFYSLWALVYSLSSAKKMLWLSWTLKIIFNACNCQSFSVLLEKSYQLKRKDMHCFDSYM